MNVYMYMTLELSVQVERGFDIVTIWSCPAGKCSELKRFSDYDLQKMTFYEGKTFDYYDNNVRCGSLVVNTNELRISFTSDGPLVEDKNPKYKGFSAIYWSSPDEAAEERPGCAGHNITLSNAAGSIYAADSLQLYPDGMDKAVSRYGRPDFEAEFRNRKCGTDGSHDCTEIARGESRWWILSS